MKKKLLRVLIVIVILYMAFVAVDCVRLRNAPTGTRPLVTLGHEQTDSVEEYQGLGYTVAYHIDAIHYDGSDEVEVRGYGAEFRLFGMLIWAWIE